MLERRQFLTGLISLIAAPAIVRVSSLMPVKAEPIATITEYWEGRVFRTSLPTGTWRQINEGAVYGRSPAMIALPDIADLLEVRRRIEASFIRAVADRTHASRAAPEV